MSGLDPKDGPLRAEHELFLEQLLCGDLDPDSPAAQELFAAHPHLRDDMLALNSTESAISQLTADAPTVVAEAQREVTDSDRDMIRGSIQRLGAAGSNRWKLIVGGLAAAVLALLLAGPSLWQAERGGPAADGRLSAVQAHSPVGEVQGTYGVFRVDVELKPGQQIQFRVFDEDGVEVAAARESATVWVPSAEQAEAIDQQPSILWTYTVEDGSVSLGENRPIAASKSD